MVRTFEHSLRPKIVLPASNSADEAKWSFADEKVSARKNTHHLEAGLDKPADIYIDSNIKLSDQDLDRIVSETSLSRSTDPENRSVFFGLKKPVPITDKTKHTRIFSVQIKGVVFDSREPVATYGGAGWPKGILFRRQRGQDP